MKTYILRLEPHDDLVSTRDKMGWAKDSRILLVWPEKGRLLNRRLDLILLQRHSRELGSQLALVTRDPEVHYFAPRLGIPVFRSLNKAQGQHWRVPRRFRRFQELAEAPAPRIPASEPDNPEPPGLSHSAPPSKSFPSIRGLAWQFSSSAFWQCSPWQPAWRLAPAWS